MKEVERLIRPDLLTLKPYSSARDDFKGKAEVFIDANENPFDNKINRYPDPLQRKLKDQISLIKSIPVDSIFLGNGSDEVLDLIIRLFCVPGTDELIITPPTYGMYKVLAAINNIFITEVPLDSNFQLVVESILKRYNRNSKILFLCSPNNPVGNVLNRKDVIKLLETFPGIVVIDEAYIDFTNEESYIKLIQTYPNLIVIQTFSKAWGMAGLRLGMAFSNAYTIGQLNKIKPPYNINVLTQEAALEKLQDTKTFKKNKKLIISERKLLVDQLSLLPIIKKIHQSDANFILAEFDNANESYAKLLEEGIVVRNRTNEIGCKNCLRITVGTPDENIRIIKTLETLS